METLRKIFLNLLWRLFGRNIGNIEVIPILNGPLRSKLLPKQFALDKLSMFFGRYEPAVVSEILRLAETSRIAYDVGANVGYITLALAHHMRNGGKIYAFEPVPSNVEALRKLTALNNLDERVQVFPMAIGDITGEQKLTMFGSTSMHLLEAAVNGQDTSICPSMTVGSTTLDSFVLEENNPAPDLIKIDVEGAEALVLKGGLRTLAAYSPSIVVEIHGPTNARSVWEVLDSLDYRWLRLTKKGRSEVLTQESLVSFFTKHSWTHHFLLVKE
jgi:FkbM family methyltransferase